MKVAVLIDTWFPFIGGGQINAWEISRRLAAKGIKIDIITRDTGNDKLKIPKNLNILKLGARVNYNDNFSKIVFLARSFFFIKNRDYDIIHVHAFLPGITARLLMVFKGIPVIFTVHGTSIGTKLNNFFLRRLEKFILTEILYSAQISVSQDFLELKNLNKKVSYIPNGVDIKKIDHISSKKFKYPTLIFVGRLHPQKNLPVLLQCINTLKQQFFSIKLLIVGNGEEKHKLRELIKNLGLSKSVKLFGEITDQQLIKLYKSSHLFVLPSIYEGQPLTLLEAWSAKLPVVVSKTGDCGYLVKDGINGYIIDNQFDPKDIAQIIKKALSNKNLEKLGKNGYNFVKKNFSWDKSADLTVEVYNSVIAKN